MAQMKKPAVGKRTKLPGTPVKLAPAPKRPSRNGATPSPLGKAPAKPLRGPDAIREYQRQISPGGMKKSKQNQIDAIDKKYPGLYKKKK